MIISIEEFLRSGEFGPVVIGMSKEEVIEYLGQPDSDNDIDKSGSILLYSWYEFFFNNENKLYSIQNDNYDSTDASSFEFKNESIEIDSWFLNNTRNQSIDNIIELLSLKKIDYSVIDYFGRNVIKLTSGVVVDFDEEKNTHGVKELIGIRYWP